MPDFNTKQRERLAAKNQAMPDGGFPIRNISDLKNAIQAYGRARNKPAVKAWIKKRARELGAEDLLPENWRTDTIMHYGVLGMKWGIRRSEKALAKASKARSSEKADKYRAKAKRIEQKHRDRAGDKTYERVKSTSTLKLLGQTWLNGGTYGALKYNQARSEGKSRGQAWVKGFLNTVGNNVTLGVLSVAEPRVTARKKKSNN